MISISVSALHLYIRSTLAHVPWEHWMVISLLPLMLIVVLYKKKILPVYSAAALGICLFFSLFLFETAVVIRCCGMMPHSSGVSLIIEYNRLFHGNEPSRSEAISNIAIFVPIGFFFSEFMSAMKRFRSWRRIGLATIFGFGLSLCIECLQLILNAGYFELTDLVTNTVGTFVGAGFSMVGRKVIAMVKK